MDNSNERQQQIDDKLLGRLDAAAEQALDQEIANNAELKAMLNDTELARQAIEAAEDQALKARLQKLESQFSTTSNAKRTTLKVVRDEESAPRAIGEGRSFFRRNFFALAASLLFLLAAGIYYITADNQVDASELYAANFEPYRNIAVPITRGQDDLTIEERAFAAYENEDYQNAITYLKKLEATPAYDFYAGQSQLALQNFPAAIDELFPLTQMDEFPLQPQAQWYLALAYLGDEQLQEAEKLLTEISANSSHPNQEQASRLLKAL